MDDKDIDKVLSSLSQDIKKDRLWAFRTTIALAIIAVLTVVLLVWGF